MRCQGSPVTGCLSICAICLSVDNLKIPTSVGYGQQPAAYYDPGAYRQAANYNPSSYGAAGYGGYDQYGGSEGRSGFAPPSYGAYPHYDEYPQRAAPPAVPYDARGRGPAHLPLSIRESLADPRGNLLAGVGRTYEIPQQPYEGYPQQGRPAMAPDYPMPRKEVASPPGGDNDALDGFMAQKQHHYGAYTGRTMMQVRSRKTWM